jgi:hypothetical protein
VRPLVDPPPTSLGGLETGHTGVVFFLPGAQIEVSVDEGPPGGLLAVWERCKIEQLAGLSDSVQLYGCGKGCACVFVCYDG